MANNDKKVMLNELALGKATEYQSSYNPELLQAIPRALNREELSIVDQQPFVGKDIWHAYELSWLNSKGKPQVALARFIINANSSNIIESKSFKLYLNSFNQTQFESVEQVGSTLKKDLAVALDAEIYIELFSPDNIQALPVKPLPGQCLDNLDIKIDNFDLNPKLLHCDGQPTIDQEISETVHSHLLKSNCLITNQPDWASIVIGYSGKKINHESLLRYLISFRQHNEFHEQCVERIFMDILSQCRPTELFVHAMYTRRGGIDINPYRTTQSEYEVPLHRINRQ